MDFALTDEQKLIQDTTRIFVNKNLSRDTVRQYDEEEKYPREPMRKLATDGWLGLMFPPEYGGSGGTILDVVILLEELARRMVALAAAYIPVVLVGTFIDHYGSEAQKEKYLRSLITGEELYCMGITEPNAGSDIASLSTSAVSHDGAYLLNGTKTFISGAHVADYMLFAARTDKTGPKHKGITMFMVDMRLPGVEVRPLKKLGMRAVGANEVFVEDVLVSPEEILGEVNRGWYNLANLFNHERCLAAACAVGAAQAVIADALQYAHERVQFDQPIGRFQAIQHIPADMQIQVDAARLLTYRAAWEDHKKGGAAKEASIAKVYASEVLRRVAADGVQVLGGYGYMMEYDMQRYYRDAKFFEIAGGTTQIQKNIIAKEMGL